MSRRSLLYRKKLMQLGQEKCLGGSTGCGSSSHKQDYRYTHAHTLLRMPGDPHLALNVLTRQDKYAMSDEKKDRLAARYKGRK